MGKYEVNTHNGRQFRANAWRLELSAGIEFDTNGNPQHKVFEYGDLSDSQAVDTYHDLNQAAGEGQAQFLAALDDIGAKGWFLALDTVVQGKLFAACVANDTDKLDP